MKIALLAPSEIPARRANTIQVMKMAQSLGNLGHSVRLAAPRSSQGIQDQAMGWDYLKRHYGLQRSFPIEWLLARPRWQRYDFSLRAVRWARQWGADLAYTRLLQAAAIASSLGMPTILEIHDMPGGRLGPWLFRWFFRGSGARRMVVITRALANDLARRFNMPVSLPFTIIAPDGVDLERYINLPEPIAARRELQQGGLLMIKAKANQPIPLPIERFTTGYTGHLYPGRGTQLLLDMATRLPDINFLIVGGEPSDVQRMHLQATQARIDNLLLTGFVPNADLPLYQAACDILLMPYQDRVAASSGGNIARYLSPMKLFEYMACERAILASDLPVLREVLNPDNAVLLPSGDLNAWVQAISDLHANPTRRQQLAAQARREVDRYTWDRRAARILEGLLQ